MNSINESIVSKLHYVTFYTMSQWRWKVWMISTNKKRKFPTSKKSDESRKKTQKNVA